jgi:3-hydroxybutyryl-CoA dehydrogenase
MKIVVAATDEQWKEMGKGTEKNGWLRVNNHEEFVRHPDADAFFNLKDNSIHSNFASLRKPVFINSVAQTLKELNAPQNVLRISGWNTFLQRPVWELSGIVDDHIKNIFDALGKEINIVPDEPGMVAARIICMIINEAYFAVDDNVSSKKEIDTAMKLGTNYPYGPFEWASMIGPENVLALLQKLSETDIRYQPSKLLITEVNKSHQ